MSFNLIPQSHNGGRPSATGKFATKSELIIEVWWQFLNTQKTQAEIARWAKVSPTTVARILKGPRPPGVQRK